MAQNYPKWPKNDARIYELFLQIFLTEKAVLQTFSLLECMPMRTETLIIFRCSSQYGTPSKWLQFYCMMYDFIETMFHALSSLISAV